MSAITRMAIAGKQADVVFLDAQWAPTTPDDAMLAKVLFDDGHISFFVPSQPTTRGNPYHLPGGTPEGGRFTGPTIDHGADPAVAANVLTSPGRTLGGSNGARVWKGADGVSRIVKLYGEPGQGQGESLANDLYRRLGIPAPESFTFEHDGDTYYAAPMIPGVSAQRELGNLGLTEERATTVLNGFGADVLTANWDTAGLTLDNVVETPDGKIVRVDNGAAFLFRAMGERKPEPMLTAVTEWESFAPGGRNRSYAKIFAAAGIDKADDIPGVSHQIDRIVALRDEVGGWKRYVTTKTPNMRADDRAKIIQMLDARTEFLIQKRATLVARSIDDRDRPSLESKSNSRLAWQLVRWNTNPHDPSNGQFTGSGGGTAADREWSSWNDVSVWEEHTPQHVDTKYCPDCAPNYGAIVEYVQDGHRPINNLLRTGATGKSPMGDWKTSDEYQRYISGLDAAIASTPETTSEQVLYRGVNIAKFNPDDLKVGNTFEDKGFASTSSDQGVALRGFSHVVGSKDKTGTLLRITVPKGSRVLDIAKATPRASDISDDEGEVLLPRGSRYTVTAVRVHDAALASFKYRIFDLTYEPPKVTLANLNTRGNLYPHVPGGSSAGGQFTGPGASGTAFPVGATSNIINPPPHATHYKTPLEEHQIAAKAYCPGCQGHKDDAEALDHYTGHGHQEINMVARAPADAYFSPQLKEQAHQQIAALDRLVASTPPTEAPLTVYRGVNAERLGFTSLDEMPGETVEDLGFTSSSKNLETAAEFAKMRGHRMVVMKIEIPKGVQALDLERAAKGTIEKEVVLPRGGQFEFTKQIGTHVIYGDPYLGVAGAEIPIFAVRYHPPVSR